jgi:hypothetical protein
MFAKETDENKSTTKLSLSRTTVKVLKARTRIQVGGGTTTGACFTFRCNYDY